MSLRDRAKQASGSRKQKPVEIPVLGEVHLKTLTALEVACIENEAEEGDFPEFVFGAMMMLVDAGGRREFACEVSGSRLSYSREDAETIANQSPETISALLREMQSLSITEEQVDEAREKSEG